MKLIKSCWVIIANTFVILNVILLLVILLLAPGILSFNIHNVPLIVVLVLMLSVSICLYVFSKISERTDVYLKDHGIPYKADIYRLQPTRHVRAYGCLSFYAECAYQDQNGEKRFVKSKLLFLKKQGYVPERALYRFSLAPLESFHDLNAVVYVDPNDTEKLYVEVTTKII